MKSIERFVFGICGIGLVGILAFAAKNKLDNERENNKAIARNTSAYRVYYAFDNDENGKVDQIIECGYQRIYVKPTNPRFSQLIETYFPQFKADSQ